MKENLPHGYTTLVDSRGMTVLVPQEPQPSSPFSPPDVPDVSDELNRIALRVIPLLERTAGDIFEIGQELLKAKELLKHGDFEDWHKEVLGLEGRTARNFMQVAKRFKTEIVSVLAPLDSTALYQLAAPSTPDSVIEEVLSRTELGDALSIKEVKALIKTHKNQEAPPPVLLPVPPPPPTLECGSAAHWQKIEDDLDACFLEIIKFIESSRSPVLERAYSPFANGWIELRRLSNEYLAEAAAPAGHAPALPEQAPPPTGEDTRQVMQTMIARSNPV